jgi:predicted ATPase
LARRERSPFVGREDSLGWLRDQWSEARRGSGRLAVIAGDPGIGKTRLASELARAAHEEGAAVLLGRCHEELLMSYQPFVEAFGSVRRGACRRRCCGPGRRARGELARLVPELAGRLPELARPGSSTRRISGSACSRPPARSWRTRRDRGRSCWCWRTCTGRTSRRPLLLTHIVRSIQTSACSSSAPYRETELGEPLASVLADLHRERAVERLRLGSLNRGEVATMISGWLGRAPPTHFAHALHRETEGNPFFIEEVLRHLIEADAVDGTEWGRLASFTEPRHP